MHSDLQGVKFKEDSMLVSDTDTSGKIIYANVDFCKAAGYEFDELVGQPHNIVRHPDMPKAVFKLLWQRVQNGKTIYAFVKNKTKDGGYYWVLGFVSPIEKNGKIIKYTSYRTLIEDENTISKVKSLYRVLVDYEKTHSADESLKFLINFLEERKLSYEDFIIRLTEGKQVTNKDSLNIDVGSYFDDHVIFRTHIVRQVALGMEDITVTKPCCCRFGKWLESVKNASYTRHKDWRNVSVAHESVHNKLQQYVDMAKNGTSEIQLNSLIDSIEDDTHTIFDTLQQVIDEYED
jgi:PAS domain S-box-containing protein